MRCRIADCQHPPHTVHLFSESVQIRHLVDWFARSDPLTTQFAKRCDPCWFLQVLERLKRLADVLEHRSPVFDGREAFVPGFGKPADADALGLLPSDVGWLQRAEASLQLLFIRSKSVRQSFLGRHVRELDLVRDSIWIAADHSREAPLNERMETWIG